MSNVAQHPRAHRATAMTLSQDVVAEKAASEFEGDYLFDHDRGRWLHWDGSRWNYEQKGESIERARMVCRFFAGHEKREKKREELGRISFATAVERFLRSDPRFARVSSDFDADPWLLGTPGGTVDLASGELRSARREDMIARSTAVGPASMATPKWDRFIWEATGQNADLSQYLQRVAGYCLTGVTTEQAVFFIHGPGGNGKGVFQHTLQRVLGEYAQSASSKIITERIIEGHTHPIAQLKGARLVAIPETKRNIAWDIERFKMLSGGDKIRANFMRQDEIEFQPLLKLMIAGNHKPDMEAVDKGIRRRLRLIPFTAEPLAPNPRLEDELSEEWPGILQWAIEGCTDWSAEGLREPAVVKEGTETYFEEQDLLGDFLEERCFIDKPPIRTRSDSAYKVPVLDLYAAWKTFAEAAGERRVNRRIFTSDLRIRGYLKDLDPADRTAMFYGITLKDRPNFNAS